MAVIDKPPWLASALVALSATSFSLTVSSLHLVHMTKCINPAGLDISTIITENVMMGLEKYLNGGGDIPLTQYCDIKGTMFK
ncbi:hypothetical protein SERLA73DRAFT_77433 [Serpula lacrymans var. lacrymans S7.3]|uniref:Uncharacterized protein n=1 Tax=Serpula lacrymans var. lacrymans (strain S7.3) TaxID=936435 RepID=F8QA94_SERL3|nr:hypothetical protein SERLA73DRAFT_77433 [Serpula lacrymans var. lacrymans S7.3]